jgi:hypothetical protein
MIERKITELMTQIQKTANCGTDDACVEENRSRRVRSSSSLPAASQKLHPVCSHVIQIIFSLLHVTRRRLLTSVVVSLHPPPKKRAFLVYLNLMSFTNVRWKITTIYSRIDQECRQWSAELHHCHSLLTKKSHPNTQSMNWTDFIWMGVPGCDE